jgi:hypothetical protein
MGMRALIRAQSDASGTQKAQPPDLISSPAKMGRYRCEKKANGKWGILLPSANSTTPLCKEGATILFGR